MEAVAATSALVGGHANGLPIEGAALAQVIALVRALG